MKSYLEPRQNDPGWIYTNVMPSIGAVHVSPEIGESGRVSKLGNRGVEAGVGLGVAVGVGGAVPGKDVAEAEMAFAVADADWRVNLMSGVVDAGFGLQETIAIVRYINAMDCMTMWTKCIMFPDNEADFPFASRSIVA